jgi:STAS domain
MIFPSAGAGRYRSQQRGPGRCRGARGAAVTAGASTVDLSGVEFFSAAAVRALFAAADLLQQRGRPLVLLDPQVSHVKALALEFLAEHPAVELIGKKSGW